MIRKGNLVPSVLLRIWRRMNSNKKRTWIRKDFGTYGYGNYLETLIGLGLIERVPVVYRYKGSRGQISRTTKGYRVK